VAFVVVLSSGYVLACGSDDPSSPDVVPASAPSSSPAAKPPGSSGPSTPTPKPPPVRRDLPLSTPSLGGFSLAPVFPTVDMIIPSALVWPKVAGASPFVLQRTGKVLQIDGTTAREVLNISSAVAVISEGGALGMDLHPSFGDGSGPTPYAFIWYNAFGQPKNKQRLSRFTWSAAGKSFDPASELVLVEEEEEHAEHNAGRVQFGPDGFLYFGNGDDINEANHQRLDRALFAGIFRIDVDARGGAVSHPPPRQPEGGHTQGYFIPNDNPFVGAPNALEEFFALGFRNPFGFSFDRKTGALWAADVGDTWREEVDLVVAGGNYQWPYREGDIIRGTTPPTIGTSRPPKYSYSHAEMGDLSAVLGGFVYRGTELPELAGKYIYTDWPSCRMWALDITAAVASRTTLFDNKWKCIPLALAEDNQGEIYVLHYDGIFKLTRDASAEQLPRHLTETTLFADVAALKPEPKLVPYEVSSPLWSDGAAKQRWITLPAGKQVELADDGSLKFPVGTTFVKQFDLPLSVEPHGRSRRLETRVLVVGTETAYGLTYRWNAEGTDADLVSEPADEGFQDDAAKQSRTWHFPSFGQCWSCHRTENRVLGFTAQQLNMKDSGGTDQLAELAARGVFATDATAKFPPGLTRPADTTASLEARASAYLAANCSSCHHAGASFLGGGDTWNALPGVALGDRGLVGAPHHNTPMARALGLISAPLVDPGHPENSILLARVKSNNPDLRMPPLARNAVDVAGALLLEQWIQALP
jgi:uncharacterized repeat protein (TIGR03806 family)